MFVLAGKPSSETLEVSLFGTGIGEALAVHLGDGDWMLVDSCRPRGEEPLNLAYLKAIGIDPAKDVKLIVATHWHDDHVAGLGELVEQCESASLVFSNALATDEFRCLIASFSGRPIGFAKEKAGVLEMEKSLMTILDRKENASPSYHPLIKTQADHRIFRRKDCEVFSLAPSPQAILEATEEAAVLWTNLEREASGVMGPRPSRSGIPCPERNHNAVALWVKWGERRILLGADLEERNNPLLGWQAVLSCNQFPDSRAQVVKVAHHGSPNGDHPKIWSDIVVKPNPFAILTTYNRGATPRPAPADIKRIQGYTDQIYYTSLPKNTANHYDKTVERTIQGIVRRRRSLSNIPGHVHMRFAPDGEVSIDVAGAAGKI